MKFGTTMHLQFSKIFFSVFVNLNRIRPVVVKIPEVSAVRGWRECVWKKNGTIVPVFPKIPRTSYTSSSSSYSDHGLHDDILTQDVQMVLLSVTELSRVTTVVRVKILHYHQLYLKRPDPIAFIPVIIDTSDHTYYDFSRLLFLHSHREGSALSV